MISLFLPFLMTIPLALVMTVPPVILMVEPLSLRTDIYIVLLITKTFS